MNNFLDLFEESILSSDRLLNFVINCHCDSFAKLTDGTRFRDRSRPYNILIVGGGIFPRTVIVSKKLFPNAKLTVLDLNKRSIDISKKFLLQRNYLKHNDVSCRFINGVYSEDYDVSQYDFAILPLALRGEISKVKIPTFMHEFLHNRKRPGTTIHPLLYKCLNFYDVKKKVRFNL